MAIAWILRDPRVTAAVVGARSVEQLDDTLQALDRLDFSAAELTEIDRHADRERHQSVGAASSTA